MPKSKRGVVDLEKEVMGLKALSERTAAALKEIVDRIHVIEDGNQRAPSEVGSPHLVRFHVVAYHHPSVGLFCFLLPAYASSSWRSKFGRFGCVHPLVGSLVFILSPKLCVACFLTCSLSPSLFLPSILLSSHTYSDD